jgi:hypothetical protein
VVPFIGRDRELDAITKWINGEPRLALCLITGPGGRGKTRLAMETAERASANWKCGFVSPAALAVLAEAIPVEGRLFAVVDYAEDDPTILIRAITSASEATKSRNCTIRIALLARNAGEWFQQFQEQTGTVADLTHHPTAFLRLRLSELATTEEDASDLIKLGRKAFREALMTDASPVPESEGTKARDALIIFSHALLLELGERTGGDDERAVLEYLLSRERSFWHRTLSRQDLREAHWRLFETLVAVMTYAGGTANIDQTDALFKRFSTQYSLDTKTTEAFRLVITAIYGSGSGIEPLQPDRLGEHLMAHHADPAVINLASFRNAV